MIAWMNWTPTVAIFFAVIAGILAVMTVYEIVSPCTERKGFLPIATTVVTGCLSDCSRLRTYTWLSWL